jgi:hypothetical protein
MFKNIINCLKQSLFYGGLMYRKILTMKRFTFFVLLLMIVQIMVAEVKAEVTNTSELTFQVTTIPELQLKYTEHFKFPVMQGEGALTKNNNIDLALTGELTPVSIYGVVDAVLTPIAFFQLTAGGRAGGGWVFNLSDDKDKRSFGSGINRSDGSSSHWEVYDGTALDGLLWKVQTGAVLQFDFAAIFPGDWNHVFFRTYHELNYRAYTRAKGVDSWYYANDDGENINGYNYYASLVVGYQMPTFVKMVAAMAEADNYLSKRDKHKEWGDEKARWIFSGIIAFDLADQLTLATICQFRTRVNYVEVTDWEKIYYRNRQLDPDKSRRRVEFYRAVISLNYKF